jgi:uncharacterized protein Smg (DUF494 family)
MNKAHEACGSDELEAHHQGDTYHPIDPSTLPNRLAEAGFERVDVRTNEFGWAAVARAVG